MSNAKRRSSTSNRRTGRRSPLLRRRRLALEGLEVRELLATFIWDGDSGSNWSEANNWEEGEAPTGIPDDDLVFPALSGMGSLTPNNDIMPLMGEDFPTFGSIVIEGTGYTFSGAALAIDDDLLTNAAGANNFNIPLILVEDFTIEVTAGSLTMGAAIDEVPPPPPPPDLSVTKTGAGDLTLTVSNGYGGGTSIVGGVLSISNNGALGAGGVAIAGGALELPGGRILANNVSIEGAGGGVGALRSSAGSNSVTGTIELTAAATFGGAGNLDLSNAISGVGPLSKAGAGVLLFSGNDGNSYSGGTSVDAGTLRIDRTMRDALPGGVTVGAATLDLLSDETITTLDLDGGSVTGTGTLTLTGVLTSRANASTATISAPLVLPDAAVIDVGRLGMSVLPDDLVITGTLSGGSTSLVKSGDGFLELMGLSPTFGNVTISGGRIEADTITLSTGSTVTGTATSFLVGNLVLPAAAVVDVTAGTLTLDAAVSGAATSFRKVGMGSLQLAGNPANTINGMAVVAEGMLVLNKMMMVNALTSPSILVGMGAVLGIVNSEQIPDTTDVTLNGGSFALDDDMERIDQLTLSNGASVPSATGTLRLDGTLTNTAGSSSIAGNLILPSPATISVTGALAISASITGAAAGLAKDGPGTLSFSNANGYTGATAVDEGVLAISDGGALGTGAVTVASDAALSLSNDILVPNSITISGTGIGNAGALRSTSGQNTISATLVLGAEASVGVDGDALTAGPLSGADDLRKVGAGLLILNASSPLYSGDTTVAAGALRLVSGTALGTGTPPGEVSVLASAALELAGGIAVANPITLNGSGPGTPVTGSLRSLAGGNSVSGGITLDTTAAIGVDADSLTAATTGIDGLGGLTKVGLGTLILTATAAGTYAGATLINAGVLQVDGSIAGTGVSVTGTATARGVLRGIGSVPRVASLANGSVFPGSMPTGSPTEILTAAGPVDLASGSIFRVELGPMGTSDRLRVTGGVNLNSDMGAGARLVVDTPAVLDPGLVFMIVDADANITTRFAGLRDGDIFRSNDGTGPYLRVRYAGSDITLTTLRIFTVTSNLDSGLNTLREAIDMANTMMNVGEPDLIVFDLPMGSRTIGVSGSQLPELTEAVVIDGTTQAGFMTEPVVINGAAAGALANGFQIDPGAEGSSILGLRIEAFAASGILVNGASMLGQTNSIGAPAKGNTITGNTVGILIDGATNTFVQSNEIVTNTQDGVRVINGATGVTIGAALDEAGGPSALSTLGNLISGNGFSGVAVIQPPSPPSPSDVLIRGNFIGTDDAGTASFGNSAVLMAGTAGVLLDGVAGAIVRDNLISGNFLDGVLLASAAIGNTIAGNFIGTDATGLAALGNALSGVHLDASNNNSVGGSTAADRNLISGNAQHGVSLTGGGGNTITGNFIGTDLTGLADLGNAQDGISIDASFANRVGGLNPDLATLNFGNLVSGNDGNGIALRNGATGNTLLGNFVGTAIDGTTALGNNASPATDLAGVLIESGAFFNTVGSVDPLGRNLISGNLGSGVELRDSPSLPQGTAFNLLRGNFIGTDATGQAAVPNSFSGVLINSAANNEIGGINTDPLVLTSGNLISGNAGHGVLILGTGATANLLQGNFVGTDRAGTTALGNTLSGVRVDAAIGNSIGTTIAARNLISGNAQNGVELVNGASGNTIAGNLVGTDVAGSITLPGGGGDFGNGLSGVLINASPANLIGGANATTSALSVGNVLSGNFLYGVLAFNLGASGNTISGNFVGTDLAGTASVPNRTSGILLGDGAAENAIGSDDPIDGEPDPLERNLISGNAQNGVEILDTLMSPQLTSGNLVFGNAIGIDVSGLQLSNRASGVLIGRARDNRVRRNTLIFNFDDGVAVVGDPFDSAGPGATGNLIDGNLVAMNLGMSPGRGAGVSIRDARLGVVDGNNTVSGNTVNSNTGDGVLVLGSTSTLVEGNTITGNTANGVAVISSGGTTVDDNDIIDNGLNGVLVLTSTVTIVDDNLIDGNGDSGALDAADGLRVEDSLATLARLNTISGTFGDGVEILGTSSGVTIGASLTANAGDFSADRNFIFGNSLNGLVVRPLPTGVFIGGNFIGTAIGGTAAAGNSLAGVLLDGSAADVTGVGVNANLISGNLADGVVISGPGASGNSITGNFIGTDRFGTSPIPNVGSGVRIDGGASGNRIGGTNLDPTALSVGNLISGNGARGVVIAGPTTTGNLLQGNFIGTDRDGAFALPNGLSGVEINAASGNFVGIDFTPAAGQRNLITGNARHGVELLNGAVDNVVAGNFIGTNAAGAGRVLDGLLNPTGNALAGVSIDGSPTVGNLIGGATTLERNLISGNAADGVAITSDANNNVVRGNFIGTEVAGSAALPSGPNPFGNGADGVRIDGSPANLVDGNLISGNRANGLQITNGSGGNTAVGNLIGTDLAGTAALANDDDGVRIDGAANGNFVFGNLISGNLGDGVDIRDAMTVGNTVANNFIGTDAGGGIAIPNANNGVRISLGADDNTIGGPAGPPNFTADAGRGNLISGNSQNGVLLENALTTGNVLLSNYIGTQLNGSDALANALSGVRIIDAVDNTIGSIGAGVLDRNVISGNRRFGIDISNAAVANFVVGNFIGTNAAGDASIVGLPAGSLSGIRIGDGSTGQIIGQPNRSSGVLDLGNLISGNAESGVLIEGPAAANIVSGNFIGTNINGTIAIPNATTTVGGAVAAGVLILGSSSNVVGGANMASPSDIFLTAGNLISGNARDGVLITGAGASSNLLQGNFVGTDAQGTAPLGNAGSGVAIGDGAIDNAIGTTALDAALANLLSANSLDGARIVDDLSTTMVPTSGNLIAGNRIGTGSVAIPGAMLGNLNNGVLIRFAGRNTVSDNSVRFNAFDGIAVVGDRFDPNGPGAVGNLVRLNVVSENFGLNFIDDGGAGISIRDARSEDPSIAGNNSVTGNTVFDNAGDGVLVLRSLVTLVDGNSITFNANGVAVIGSGGTDVLSNSITQNVLNGVLVSGAADTDIAFNTIRQNGLNGVLVSVSEDTDIASNVAISTNGTSRDAANADGVQITDGSRTTTVRGNLIEDNPGDGVRILGLADRVTIGGTTDLPNGLGADGNRLRLNGFAGLDASGDGIAVLSAVASSVLISGNFIGTDDDGETDRGNRRNGIRIDGVAGVRVVGNLVSGNDGNGVEIAGAGAVANLLTANFIGTDSSGIVGLANTLSGVRLTGGASANSIGQANTIAGTLSGGNLISGNTETGVRIDGASTSGNIVTGNFIGTDRTGNLPLGNALAGIRIEGSPANVIGGTNVGDAADGVSLAGGNLVSANGAEGIALLAASSNRLTGNFVGTNTAATATLGLGNAADGIALPGDSRSNVVGPPDRSDPRLSNIIGGNTGNGVRIADSTTPPPDTAPNLIQGNFIGTNAGGTVDIGNVAAGVLISHATNNQVLHNLVKFNGGGIVLTGNVSGNTITGNTVSMNGGTGPGDGAEVIIRNARNATVSGNTIIGGAASGILITNSTATLITGNEITANGRGGTGDGIRIEGNSDGVTIGDLDAAPGVLTPAGNLISGNVNGVAVLSAVAGTVVIAGNFIGTDRAGALPFPNTGSGVLILQVAGVTVSGNLISGNSANGVHVSGAMASGNAIRDNFIGTDAAGTSSLSNALGNGFGVRLSAGANGNVIGTDPNPNTPTTGNLISGNRNEGVLIEDAPRNLVAGNFIGTDRAGSVAVGNLGDGVAVVSERSVDNSIGGPLPHQRNLIAGNTSGVRIGGSNNTSVDGNFIGTDAAGTAGIGNQTGVSIETMRGATITGNLVSGNFGPGVSVFASSGISIRGNRIGTDASGAARLANLADGVLIGTSTDVTVGAGTDSAVPAVFTSAGPGNLISGNGRTIVFNGEMIDVGSGVRATFSTGLRIAGNLIGLDAAGTSRLGNFGAGVLIEMDTNRTLVAGNAIAANRGNGVQIRDVGSIANSLTGNAIGTNAASAPGLGNGGSGVLIAGSAANLVGGAGAGNVIAGNVGFGIAIAGETASGNLVQGNVIGLAVQGNVGAGLVLLNSPANTVGGTVPGQANVIGGNYSDGLVLQGAGASSNQVFGNRIGVDLAGTTRLQNAGDGIRIVDAPVNFIGGPNSAFANVVSGNAGSGIAIDGESAMSNTIQGNFIGTDLAGSFTLRNNVAGVRVENAPHNRIIFNTISGNGLEGVGLLDVGTFDTVVSGNRIGTNLAGTAVLPNGADGVFIRNAPRNGVTENVISGNLANGVQVSGPMAAANTITGNLIGTDLAGTAALANEVRGVLIELAPGTILGTPGQAPPANAPIARTGNLISGNRLDGVQIVNAGAGTVVAGNFVGTNARGADAVPNGLVRQAALAPPRTVAGIRLTRSNGVTIQSNLVSGNGTMGDAASAQAAGIILEAGSSANQVTGNRIGTDLTGRNQVANSFHGIFLDDSPANTISGNTTSGNGTRVESITSPYRSSGAGIFLFDDGSTGNVVRNNFVGVDPTGVFLVPNSYVGVVVYEAPRNTIGGDAPGAPDRNILSGNVAGGILIYQRMPGFEDGQATGNLVAGNIVGLDSNGQRRPTDAATQLQPYVQDVGVYILGASGNTIRSNVISGNGDVNSPPAEAIDRNRRGSGLIIANAFAADGTQVVPDPTGNEVFGNFIGTTFDATVAVFRGGRDSLGVTSDTSNEADGILLLGAVDTTIGGKADGQANIISANGSNGVDIREGTSGSLVVNNLIGWYAANGVVLGDPDFRPQNTRLAAAGNGRFGIVIDFQSRRGNSVPSSLDPLIRNNRLGAVRRFNEPIFEPRSDEPTGEPMTGGRRRRGAAAIDGAARPFRDFRTGRLDGRDQGRRP